jgi:hypothetical protein
MFLGEIFNNEDERMNEMEEARKERGRGEKEKKRNQNG